MKEVLKLQGLIAHATVRPPQLGVGDDERAELRRLADRAGLLAPRERHADRQTVASAA
jgi:dihydrodipicolinate synthase/N-acetylneuraminate lyase